jgi:hypothetical protein
MFEGDTQLTDMTPAILKNYGSIYKREGDISPTLPADTDNPILNVFGTERGFTSSPAGPMDAPTMEQSKPTITSMNYGLMKKGVDKVLLDMSEDYTIKAGDTLSEIARDKGTTLGKLRDANPQIKDLNVIKPGDVIKIPGKVKNRKSVYQDLSPVEMRKISRNKITKRAVGGGVALRGFGKVRRV